uniref:Uncharacterized protein n=1 Tax=Marmota marmota marmota TaxID=9994 RepID=A0A8C5Z7Y3_MARMA
HEVGIQFYYSPGRMEACGQQWLVEQPEAQQSGTNPLQKHSYWLDLWLFVLLDVVLFLFVYLLPWWVC